MTSDRIHFNKLFSADPSFLKDFANLELEGDLKYETLREEDLEFPLDGWFVSSNPKDHCYLVDFYSDDEIGNRVYYRMLGKLGIVGGKNLGKTVSGLIIFSHRRFDPKTEPWYEFAVTSEEGFRVLYLDDLLADLAKRMPDHPLIPTFAPFLAAEDELKQQLSASFQKLQNMDMASEVKDVMLEVFTYWAMERLNAASLKDVQAMLGMTTP